MKKILFCLILISSICMNGIAQTGAPQLINYQAIARDAAGNAITTGNIGVKFEILQTAGMVLVYSEAQTAAPNSAGIFTAAIGAGPAIFGTFSTIGWGSANHYIRVSIDPTGGTAYTVVGTSQLLSVPYALYSEKTKSPLVGLIGNILSINGSTISLPGSSSPTVTGTGMTNVTQAGNSYTVDTPAPTLIGAGSTTVTGAYPSYTITSSAVTGTTATLPSNLTINAPHSVVTNTTLNSSTITIVSPTLTGAGSATVSGSFPNYVITTPLSGVNTTTMTGVGVATVSPLTGNNFTVSVPPTNLTYNGSNGIISFSPAIGSNTVNITPALNFAAGILTVGPPSNTINLSSGGPWTKPTATTVVLNNTPDLVGIGTNAPNAKLDLNDNTNVNVLNINKTSTIGEGASIYITNPANSSAVVDASTNGSGNVILASTSGSGYSGNFSKSGSGTAFISSHTGTIGAAGSFNVNNVSNNSTALAASTTGSGDAGSFNAGGNGNGIFVQANGTGSAGSFFKNATGGYGIVTTHAGNSGTAGFFNNSNASNNSQALTVQTSGNGDAVGVYNLGSGRAIYASNTSSAMTMQLSNTGVGDGISTTVAGGRVLFAQNNSNPYATIEASNNGGGPVYYGSKPPGTATGNVANFSNNSTTNVSDVMSVYGAGPAPVIHAINGPTVAGGSNVGVWIDGGHIKASNTTANITSVNSSGGWAAITATTCTCNDVRGLVSFQTSATGFGGGNSADVTVSFQKLYPIPPFVTITPLSDTQGVDYMVTNVTTGGFTIRLYKSANAGGPPSIGGSPTFKFSYMVME